MEDGATAAGGVGEEEAEGEEGLTINEALECIRDSLGLQSARPKALVQAALEKLQLPPPAAGESFKQQIALLCDACKVETRWAASPRAGERRGEDAGFPKLTVSVSWLKRFVEVNGETLAGKTTDEVVRTLLIPQTAERRCSVAEVLAGQRLRPEIIDDTAMCVGDATCLVSHAWSDSFLDTVGTIVDWGQTKPDPDVEFVWLDVFAVSQHAPPLTETQDWDALYRTAVDEIGQVIMVLTPWDRPSALSHLWCTWDFLCAFDTQAELMLRLPASERKRLEEALAADPDAMRQLIRNVEDGTVTTPGTGNTAEQQPLSVKHAQARTKREHECLVAAIALLAQQKCAQWAEAVDIKIRRHLHEWCLQETLAECRRSNQQAGTRCYLHELATLLAQCDDSEIQKLQQAENLLMELFALQQADLGVDDASTRETVDLLRTLRARLPIEEGEPHVGAYIQVAGLPVEGGVQYYKVTWRDDAGVVRQARHRYSEFDAVRNHLLKAATSSLAIEVQKLPFPGKRWVHGTDVVAERAAQLTEFFHVLVVTKHLIMPSDKAGSTKEAVELFKFLAMDEE
eukprot:COSAG02_NODE_4091_length_5797_cov_127.687434_2_plen_570_part_00